MVNKILLNERVSKNRGKIIITMIPKLGNILFPDNYRGYFLISSLTKIFTQILKDRLVHWEENNELISEIQKGFRRKRCCTDNGFIQNSPIQIKFHQHRKIFVAFIDFRKAFDTVNHHTL